MKKRLFIILAVLLASSLILPGQASDFVLGIFGNANMDDAIDENDIDYLTGVIDGKNGQTKLSDANYDGKIDEADKLQIEKIILDKAQTLTIVDAVHRNITLKVPARDVICLNIQSAEAMRSLQAKDRIVGITKYIQTDEFFPDFSNVDIVGGKAFQTPDFEQIIKIGPDVVFTAAWSGPQLETINKLEPSGISVIHFDFLDPSTYIDEITKLGYILGCRSRADDHISFYRGVMDMIAKRVDSIQDQNRPKVYYEANKYQACAGGTPWSNQIEIAGGNNIFGTDRGSYPHVDPEEVLIQDPDIIIQLNMSWTGYNRSDASELEAIRDEILSRPELQQVSAIKNGRVYVIGGNYIPGSPRHFVSVAYMAKWFYRERFKDLNVTSIHQEYVTRFQELNFDLSKKGVFTYPPGELN
ncbi:MAG: Cobalamin-binding protein precursor [Methanosaeta sp. PtaU1.Bin112]|nr:MAG: Cobalamin-binding protein precursor [Methanosaeta sp. PtaU1.Bin112]